jgi:hypothetical protein
MPTKTAKKNAKAAKRQGKRPSTQAGSFVKEEMHRMHRGGSAIKSKKQAIAIGLSEARRSGVKLSPPKKGKSSTAVRKKAQKDVRVGQGKAKVSRTRSRGAKKAAATRQRNARQGS